MTNKVLVPVSTGFEEIEMCTIVDVLRRGDVDVTLAALTSTPVIGRSGIAIVPDAILNDDLLTRSWDMIVLAGGLPNAYTLRDDARIVSLLQRTAQEGRWIGAICAAPAALQKAGLLKNRRATNYPACSADIPDADYCDDDVVVAGHIITSRGPATAMAFAISLLTHLQGDTSAQNVAEGLLYPC